MTIANAREYLASRTKAEGVFRIVVLGDSMTYGYGVGASESLPAQLERLLNRSVWDRHTEVINCGQAGMAVYDAWSVFNTRGRFYEPDLVVLVLCDNDAMMYGVSTDYYQRVRESWQEDNVTFPYFALAFAGLEADLAELGVPLEVAFYYQRDDDTRQRCLEVISELCARHGFGFSDLSAEFVGVADDRQERYRVSSADAHPSAYAHNLAARALARRLLAGRHLSTSPTVAEDALIAGCVWQAAETVAAGSPLAWAGRRLAAVLSDKGRSRARLELPAAERLADGERSRIVAEAESLASQSARLLGWRSLIRLLVERLPDISRLGQALDRQLQELDKKKLFVLECNLADAGLRYQPRRNDSAEQGSPERLQPARQRLERWSETLRRGRESLASIAPDVDGPLAPLAALVAAERGRVAADLRRFWDDAGEIFAACLKLIARCQELLENHHRSEPGAENHSRTLRDVATSFTEIESSLIAWSDLLLLDDVEGLASLELEPCPAHTVVLVTSESLDIRSEDSEERHVRLRVDARMPPLTVAEEHHLIRDGERHAYLFELPLVGLAAFTLSIPRQVATLETVEVYTRRSARRVFHASDLETTEPGAYVTPLFLIPS